MTFQFRSIAGLYYLDLLPPVGSDSKSYREFYKENVCIHAKVQRTTSYKKPKLELIDIALLQPDLMIDLSCNVKIGESKVFGGDDDAIKFLLPYREEV